jgi:hypothetical protein
MRGASPLLLLLALAAAPSGARAEPVFAQREGVKCSRCHVNVTGGGKRTVYGYQYARTQLSLFSPPRASDAEIEGRLARATPGEQGLFDPHLGRYVSVGANLRLGYQAIFAKQVHNTFANPEANLYLGLDLGRWLTLYGDVSLAEASLEGREAFALLRLWRGLYLKGGYLLPPFGLRVWGEEEFVRKETGFNFASPELGLELGFDGGHLSAAASLTNGSGASLDSDKFKKVSLLVEASFRYARVALSGSFNTTETQRLYLGDSYLGLSLGRLTLLGEADLAATYYRHKGATVYALLCYAEADLLIRRGINLKLAYGYHDPALDVPEDARFSLRAGLEVYPRPLVAASVFYTLRESVPQDEVGNADTLLAELHVYF